MSVNLPEPIAAYFHATNKHDIDAMLTSFDENSYVTDEGQTHHGRAAIRAWMEDAARKYRFSVDIKDVLDANGETVVSGLVSGDFPGSPVVLRHAFALSGAIFSAWRSTRERCGTGVSGRLSRVAGKRFLITGGRKGVAQVTRDANDGHRDAARSWAGSDNR